MHFKVMSLTWLIQFGCTKERRKIVAGAKCQDIKEKKIPHFKIKRRDF